MIRWDLSIDYPGISVRSAGHVEQGEMLGIYGASGSGKSTLLRAIAGLERGDRGTLEVDGECWLGPGVRVPAHRRRCAMVSQRPVLFDHLDARANVAFGRRRRGIGEDPELLAYLAGVLHLDSLMERRVNTLSGGERQRLAIARALYSGPRVLLLDEPLTGLDDDRKRRITDCLARLQRELAVPTLFVSHHLDEHARLSDRMAFVEAGRYSAIETTHRTLQRHGLNVIDGSVDDHARIVPLCSEGPALHVRWARPPLAGTRVRIMLPAEQIVGLPATAMNVCDNEFQIRGASREGAYCRVDGQGLDMVVPESFDGRVAFNLLPANVHVVSHHPLRASA